MTHMVQPIKNVCMAAVGMLTICGLPVVISSCSTFRPMPTHGGGKRFDEEQRLVSATIQHTSGRVDYSRIKRSKVSIEVTAPETSGSLAERYDWKENSKVTPTPPRFPGPQTLFQYRVNPWLQNAPAVTSQDVQFLEKCLEANLRSRNYQVVSRGNADVHMVVLVDCLGTNQGRNDFALAFRDRLTVTCAITWYLIDARTQEVLVAAKSFVSQGTYEELNLRASPWDAKKRDLGVVTEEDKLMLNPHTASVATGARGSAPVSALEQRLPGGPKRQGGGAAGMNFKDLPVPLPQGLPGDISPGLLPPLDGEGEMPAENKDKLMEELRQLPMGDLIRAGWVAAREKDTGKLGAVIDAIREKNPEAPAIDKLEERQKQLAKP